MVLTLTRLGSLFLWVGLLSASGASLIHLTNYLRPSRTSVARLLLAAGERGRARRFPRLGHPGSLLVAGAWSGCAGWMAFYLLSSRIGTGPKVSTGIGAWLAVTVFFSVWGAINAAYARAQV